MALSISKVARNVSPVETRVGRGRKRWWSLEHLTQLVFVLPAVVYLCLFFGYPLVKNLIMSFQNYTTSTFFTGMRHGSASRTTSAYSRTRCSRRQ